MKLHLLRSLLAFLMLACSAFGQESILASGVTVQVRLAGVPPEEINMVNGPYTISTSGTLTLPHLKSEIKATGLRPTELASRIAAAYKAAEIYTNPNIVVQTNKDPTGDFVVSVGGEVRTPRAVQIRPGLDLFGAITEAGGPSEFADMKKVRLIRKTQEMVLDMRKVNAQNSVELMAGDKVIVPGG
jgi:protein involved in polysaccharide export with SLBB domain